MDEPDRAKLLKEELDKIHQLEREVKEIEKIEKQQLRAENNNLGKSHEKAKRAITHGEPASSFKEFLAKSKFLLIGIFVALVIAAIIIVPTKTVERVETIEYTSLEPYNVSEEQWVAENQTISELVNFRFETKAIAVPSFSGTKNQNLIWEITIRNFENETGCWEYDYTIYKDDDEFDEGTIENMCVDASAEKTFTTPLYDMGQVDEKLEYSMDLEPRTIPVRNMTVISNKNVLKTVTVTKYRNETKYKNETINKTVNWLFGFSIF